VSVGASSQSEEAALTVAQTNLDYATIHVPIDGTVIARNVDVGQKPEVMKLV
jgi:multidrug resistance efflux pump